jgi:hypothetical protein
VAYLVEFLTAPGNLWTYSKGKTHLLSRGDILCVAPFNDQVNRLSDRLPGLQVGTVETVSRVLRIVRAAKNRAGIAENVTTHWLRHAHPSL